MASEVTIGGGGTLFVGEDKVLRFEFFSSATVAVDITGWVLRFDIRKKDNAADPAIVFYEPLQISGVFNSVRASNQQRAFVPLTDTDMNLFKAGIYRYSVKRMDDGSETVTHYGDFAPEKATAP